MNVPLLIRYPLDYTGKSPDNRVEREPHELTNRQIRAIALHHGAYYLDSIRIWDTANGIELTKAQWSPGEFYIVPSTKSEKDVYAIILITDTSVSSNVEVTYQAVGGEFSTSTQAIINQIERMSLDERPVYWRNVLGKPDRYRPAPHLHPITDTYGYESLVHACYKIRDAILMGDAASHEEIMNYIDRVNAELSTSISRVDATLQAHIAAKGNVHQMVARDVNAYTIPEVDNLIQTVRDGLKVVTQVTAVNTALTSAHRNKYLLVSGSGEIRIPGNQFLKDDVVYVRALSGVVTIVPLTGVTIRPPYGQNLVLPGAGSTVALVFSAPTVADLIGVTRLT